jgi:hypothetical protein
MSPFRISCLKPGLKWRKPRRPVLHSSATYGVGYENHTSFPAPGQILLYPGGISETEILLAYGGVHFASKMGQLAGNHFITLTSGLDRLSEIGKRTLWEGAQTIRFDKA